jgi:hypothetical protein
MAQQVSSTGSTAESYADERNPARRRATFRGAPNRVARATLATGLLGAAFSSNAVDGCLVLLCLAAPSWSSIPQCVPPVRSVLDDLAHGRPFPTCNMAGAGNTASNNWSSAPYFCPAQYTTSFDGNDGTRYECRYLGAISVMVNEAIWTRTWWNFSGETVTEYAPAAKAALGSFDTRYDDDYAAWLATPAPPTPVCTTC